MQSLPVGTVACPLLKPTYVPADQPIFPLPKRKLSRSLVAQRDTIRVGSTKPTSCMQVTTCLLRDSASFICKYAAGRECSLLFVLPGPLSVVFVSSGGRTVSIL